MVLYLVLSVTKDRKRPMHPFWINIIVIRDVQFHVIDYRVLYEALEESLEMNVYKKESDTESSIKFGCNYFTSAGVLIPFI